MTELLKSWVNDEVGLSEPVEDFEADFANGYLLGELLYRFNQQPTFGKFINKPTADAKISNWCLLEPRIRQLNIKFDSKAAYSIMCQEKGVLTKVLYQIKVRRPLRARVYAYSAVLTMHGRACSGVRVLPRKYRWLSISS